MCRRLAPHSPGEPKPPAWPPKQDMASPRRMARRAKDWLGVDSMEKAALHSALEVGVSVPHTVLEPLFCVGGTPLAPPEAVSTPPCPQHGRPVTQCRVASFVPTTHRPSRPELLDTWLCLRSFVRLMPPVLGPGTCAGTVAPFPTSCTSPKPICFPSFASFATGFQHSTRLVTILN